MAEKLLLINPRRRRKASAKKRRASRRNRMPAALERYWASRRGRKSARKSTRRARRRNPVPKLTLDRVMRRRSSRRRNPINVRGVLGNVVPMVTQAAVGAAGAIAVDYGWGMLKPKLPAALQSPMAGSAAKILFTVAAGQLLRGVTRGYSQRMAQGALTVQMDQLLRNFLPANVRQSLAYANPAPVVQGTAWVGPNAVRRGVGMNGLVRAGARTPLLSGMAGLVRRSAPTPLLSGVSIATRRAGVSTR